MHDGISPVARAVADRRAALRRTIEKRSRRRLNGFGVFLLTAVVCTCCTSPSVRKETESTRSLVAPEAIRTPTADATRPQLPPEAIAFSIKADGALNRFRDSAHALHLCLYQLKDPNPFNQLAGEKGGMAKLLECGRFDPSVANARRIVVQPGRQTRETCDRADGARYLGIATGYYGTGKEKTSHLAPLSEDVEIELGPHEIEKVTVK